jgi:hypothetical protein
MKLEQLGTYPFGEPLRRVEQADRGPKSVFVLGVYSSAVHAQWLAADGKVLVRALAVASEPYIFWRGDGVDDIISRIKVPVGAGKLVSAAPQLNGPSGNTLDNDILQPLGISRADAWLCDLVPHTCANPKQKAALEREYVPRAKDLGLPAVDLPDVPQNFADGIRRQEVLAELVESKASTIILLGDEPLRQWLGHFDPTSRRLSDFGEYGRLHNVIIDGKPYRVLPLAHPRQIGGLGSHSPKWRCAHDAWKPRARVRAPL